MPRRPKGRRGRNTNSSPALAVAENFSRIEEPAGLFVCVFPFYIKFWYDIMYKVKELKLWAKFLRPNPRERVNATRQILDFIKFYFKRSFKGAFILGKVKF